MDLVGAGQKVRVGLEISGHARWFERLLGELQFELWIGDAAEIRTKRVHLANVATCSELNIAPEQQRREHTFHTPSTNPAMSHASKINTAV